MAQLHNTPGPLLMTNELVTILCIQITPCSMSGTQKSGQLEVSLPIVLGPLLFHLSCLTLACFAAIAEADFCNWGAERRQRKEAGCHVHRWNEGVCVGGRDSGRRAAAFINRFSCPGVTIRVNYHRKTYRNDDGFTLSSDPLCTNFTISRRPKTEHKKPAHLGSGTEHEGHQRYAFSGGRLRHFGHASSCNSAAFSALRGTTATVLVLVQTQSKKQNKAILFTAPCGEIVPELIKTVCFSHNGKYV